MGAKDERFGGSTGSVNASAARAADAVRAAEGDQPPPLLKLQRTADGGLFDRLADNFKTLWGNADETLTDLQQLVAYLTNADADDDLEDEDEDGTSFPEPKGIAATEPPTPPAPPASTWTETEQTGRRWPRRPS